MTDQRVDPRSTLNEPAHLSALEAESLAAGAVWEDCPNGRVARVKGAEYRYISPSWLFILTAAPDHSVWVELARVQDRLADETVVNASADSLAAHAQYYKLARYKYGPDVARAYLTTSLLMGGILQHAAGDGPDNKLVREVVPEIIALADEPSQEP